MNDLLLVLGAASLAAFLTALGAPLAERLDVSDRGVSAALQFAAGMLSAIVAFSLMPPAVRAGAPLVIVPAFFLGGAIFIGVANLAARRQTAAEASAGPASGGFYAGILVDLLIDGVVIGLGSTVAPGAGLLLALGVAASTLPLAFVATATARRQGMPPARRRMLTWLFVLCMIGGTLLGYLVLRNQPLPLRLALLAVASGFLLTTVTQSMIPEASRAGESSLAGILYLAGLSLYALMTLVLER